MRTQNVALEVVWQFFIKLNIILPRNCASCYLPKWDENLHLQKVCTKRSGCLAQHLKTLLGMLHIMRWRPWIQVLATLLLIQLPTNVHFGWEKTGDSSDTWIIATHTGDLNGVLAPRFNLIEPWQLWHLKSEPMNERFFILFLSYSNFTTHAQTHRLSAFSILALFIIVNQSVFPGVSKLWYIQTL